MTLAITPTSRMGLLVGQPVVVSSAFLHGPITPWVIVATNDIPGRISVQFSPIRGAGHPETTSAPTARTLESFVMENCRIDTIGRITLIDGARWPMVDKGASTVVDLALPIGLTSDDLYPGIREYDRVRSSAAPYVSYVLGTIEAPVAPEVAHARVAAIKDQYGQLLSDVVYRIENAALFDTSVHETKEFTLLLMKWDDGERTLPAGQLDGLSRQLQLAFDAARRHAETLGIRHLPWTARRTARQAVKAAHLANNATSDGEREAARAKVAKLLGSLALFYLPSPDQSAKLLGAVPAQLDA